MIHFAELRRQGLQTTSERRRLLERHQHDVEQQIQRLEQHRDVLQQKIARYQEREARFAAVSRSDATMRQQEE